MKKQKKCEPRIACKSRTEKQGQESKRQINLRIIAQTIRHRSAIKIDSVNGYIGAEPSVYEIDEIIDNINERLKEGVPVEDIVNGYIGADPYVRKIDEIGACINPAHGSKNPFEYPGNIEIDEHDSSEHVDDDGR